MNKQIFTFPRRNGLRGVVCGRCDNAYTLAALEHVTIVGNTLYFHIAHQDRGNIDHCLRLNCSGSDRQNEMIASVLGNNITIDPANPPARPDGAPFTLVGPIAPGRDERQQLGGHRRLGARHGLRGAAAHG